MWHMNLSMMYLPSQLPDIGAPMDPIAEERSGEDTTSNEGSEHNPAEHHDSMDNIKLQRVTGVSLRHTKAPPGVSPQRRMDGSLHQQVHSGMRGF